MKIYTHIDDFIKLNNSVVTIGTFDGVHIGHQKIISRLNEIAVQVKGETVILTFFPHPRMILHPEDMGLKMLTTIKEKSELLEIAGIDHLIITPFTRDFSNLSPQQYIRNVLVDQIGTKQIVIGYDHRFGKDREGGLDELQKFASHYDYQVEEIPEQDIHDVAVSSTRIRTALTHGHVDTANEFLGYNFHITGKVIKGDQIGRTLGFPTANIFVEEAYKLIPGDGIYAVTVQVATDERAPFSTLKAGMGYIGSRPTINGMARNIEVNIFDFDAELYGKTLRVYFHSFIREDIRFDSLEALRLQLDKDKQSALSILS